MFASLDLRVTTIEAQANASVLLPLFPVLPFKLQSLVQGSIDVSQYQLMMNCSSIHF